jgi:hypothetical protein
MEPRPPAAAADVSPASWIGPRLSARFGTVTRTVPAGFEAYARIFHPVDPAGPAPLRWSAVAAAHGRIMHSLAQYSRISDPAPGHRTPPALADLQPPDAGELDPACLRTLCDLLAAHQATSARCWFAVADLRAGGNSIVSFSEGAAPKALRPAPASWQLDPAAPRFTLPHREYYLYTGPVGDAARIGRWITDDWFLPHSPNLFWPGNQHWCVATELDFDSTLVGGSIDLITQLTGHPDLEAWPVEPGDSLAWDGDTINRL